MDLADADPMTAAALRIVILRQDPEWAEDHLRRELETAGHAVRTLDVRDAGGYSVDDIDLALNRVYASVGNRDRAATRRALEWLRRCEVAGIPCLNSAAASRADYEKHYAARLMHRHRIPTPITLLLDEPGAWRRRREEIERLGFPLVLKPDTGGRARGVRLVDGPEALPESLAEAFGAGDDGAVVVQPYLASIRHYDWRISVAGGRISYAGTRDLVPGRRSEPAWLGSMAEGSVWTDRQPDAAAVRLAMRATAAIGAEINDVDLRETAAGLVVIENNPTPSFAPGEEPYVANLLSNLRQTAAWQAALRRARGRVTGKRR